MLYRTPDLTPSLQSRLDELDRLRTALGVEVGSPGPWLGTLRRAARASTVESSVSIEGYRVRPGEGLAIVSGASSVEPDDENGMAVACYARAMDHVAVLASDPNFEWRDRVILDLHFDACYFQRDKGPGIWRTGPIYVTGREGRSIYEGPEADRVPGLMAEMIEWLRMGDLAAHVTIRAAMAHLHTVSVHPFRDGNGRISRILQSLVLAREALLSPELASIEEYLASHTQEYYDVLQRVQRGRYSPERDASEWVAFCIEAHIEQAQRRLDQVARASKRWRYLEGLVQSRGWPDRLVIALEQSLIGGTDRARYGHEAGMSSATASNDFRRLLDAGLVAQEGRGRSTRYFASVELHRQVEAATA
jgi:hypothetical protein